jgi:hypothetical protein
MKSRASRTGNESFCVFPALCTDYVLLNLTVSGWRCRRCHMLGLWLGGADCVLDLPDLLLYHPPFSYLGLSFRLLELNLASVDISDRDNGPEPLSLLLSLQRVARATVLKSLKDIPSWWSAPCRCWRAGSPRSGLDLQKQSDTIGTLVSQHSVAHRCTSRL